MRILIVEDNEISAGIIESNLRQRRYETIVARTGTEALKMLETYWISIWRLPTLWCLKWMA